MPRQKVKCSKCGHERELIRKNGTAKEYSFYCTECMKEVPQDMEYRKKQDYEKVELSKEVGQSSKE